MLSKKKLKYELSVQFECPARYPEEAARILEELEGIGVGYTVTTVSLVDEDEHKVRPVDFAVDRRPGD